MFSDVRDLSVEQQHYNDNVTKYLKLIIVEFFESHQSSSAVGHGTGHTFICSRNDVATDAVPAATAAIEPTIHLIYLRLIVRL